LLTSQFFKSTVTSTKNNNSWDVEGREFEVRGVEGRLSNDVTFCISNLDKLLFMTQIPTSVTCKLKKKTCNIYVVLYMFDNDSPCLQNNRVGLRFEKETRG
jgi:hypothetical protein